MKKFLKLSLVLSAIICAVLMVSCNLFDEDTTTADPYADLDYQDAVDELYAYIEEECEALSTTYPQSKNAIDALIEALNAEMEELEESIEDSIETGRTKNKTKTQLENTINSKIDKKQTSIERQITQQGAICRMAKQIRTLISSSNADSATKNSLLTKTANLEKNFAEASSTSSKYEKIGEAYAELEQSILTESAGAKKTLVEGVVRIMKNTESNQGNEDVGGNDDTPTTPGDSTPTQPQLPTYKIDGEIAKTYGNRKGIINMTFDDGYDTDSAWFVSNTLKQYGYRASANLTVNFVSGNVAEWKKILAEGVYDVSVHGYAHDKELLGMNASNSTLIKEVKTAQEKLKELFPDQRLLTYASPFAKTDSASREYISRYYIANRDGPYNAVPTESQIKSGATFEIGCAFMANNGMTAEQYNSAIDNKLRTKNAWIVCLYHRVENAPTQEGLSATRTAFADHVKYLYDTYGDTIWVCSFEEASLYKREQTNAKIETEMTSGTEIKVTVTDTLDDSIYDHPLTCNIYLPDAIKTAKVGNKTLEIKTASGEKYVTLDIVPDSGTVTITVTQ